MPIIEARAIPYPEMVNLIRNQPVKFSGNEPLKPFDKVWIVSITDPETPAIFKQDGDNVIALKFLDIDPENINFVPPPDNVDFMTEEQAEKIVDFLERAHADKSNGLLISNCHMGWCRSGAVVDFAATVFGLGFHDMKRRNPQMIPNHWVRYNLFKEWFKKQRL